MKKISLILVIGAALALLTACGSTDVVSGYTSGDVKLGQYKGVTYEPDETEIVVTDEEIANRVSSQLLDANSYLEEVTDRTVVEDGDSIVYDYAGTIDGVAFDGGTATDAELVIGSGSMIDGFEDGIIGCEVGVAKDITVTFPENYKEGSDLNGKEAVFNILVKKISTEVTPEYTDETVAEYTDMETVAEYDQFVKDKLTEEKQKVADTKKQFEIFKKIILSSEFDEQAISPKIIENRQNLIQQQNAMYSQYLGLDVYGYYRNVMGMSDAQTDEYFDSMAKQQTKYMFILAAVADEENITASDSEIEELATELKDSYGLETVDELYEQLKTAHGVDGKEVLASQARLNKALDLIMSEGLALTE